MIEILIQNGANVDAKDDDGNTIFHIAAVFNKFVRLRYMCTNPIYKFDPSQKNYAG